MALYPDVSPTAPVSRDDLAQAMLMQQMMQSQGLAGGQQPGDASSIDIGALFGSNTPSFESGQPSAPAGGREAGAQPSGQSFGSGAMTTSNASMVGDPMGESGPIGVPGYGREGDTTAPSSQASQAADRAALADAALAAAQNNVSDPLADASQTFGSAFSTNSPGFMNAGAQPAGVPTGYSTTNQPGATPVSTTSFTNPNAPPADAPIDMFESGYNDFFGAPPAGNLFEGQTPSPFAGAAITPTGSPTMVGTVHPSGYTGRSAVSDPSDPGDPGNAPSAPGSDFSAAGFSGPGGFGAFGGGAATGGYEGSASMGNTTGAQGFTAGGGGFGDFGAASPGTGGTSAGGDPGGGAVGGFGGGSSSGDNTGSGDGVGGVG